MTDQQLEQAKTLKANLVSILYIVTEYEKAYKKYPSILSDIISQIQADGNYTCSQELLDYVKSTDFTA